MKNSLLCDLNFFLIILWVEIRPTALNKCLCPPGTLLVYFLNLNDPILKCEGEGPFLSDRFSLAEMSHL